MSSNISTILTADRSELPSRYGRYNSWEAAPGIYWVGAAWAPEVGQTEQQAEKLYQKLNLLSRMSLCCPWYTHIPWCVSIDMVSGRTVFHKWRESDDFSQMKGLTCAFPKSLWVN